MTVAFIRGTFCTHYVQSMNNSGKPICSDSKPQVSRLMQVAIHPWSNKAQAALRIKNSPLKPSDYYLRVRLSQSRHRPKKIGFRFMPDLAAVSDQATTQLL